MAHTTEPAEGLQPGDRVQLCQSALRQREFEVTSWPASEDLTEVLLSCQVVSRPPEGNPIPKTQFFTVKAVVTGRSWVPDDSSEWFLLEFTVTRRQWQALASAADLKAV